MNFGPTELIIVLVIVLLLFGTTRLPKLAKSIGEASKEFKKGVSEGAKDSEQAPPVASGGDEKITLTKAELDALIAERQDQARRDGTSSAP